MQSIYPERYITLCMRMMREQGEDVKRWANDSNPVIAATFKECIEVAERGINAK